MFEFSTHFQFIRGSEIDAQRPLNDRTWYFRSGNSIGVAVQTHFICVVIGTQNAIVFPLGKS